MSWIFVDRRDAGQRLASKLAAYAHVPGVSLFALPRGGVVVGAEIAKALKLPLDVIVTRKIGAPFDEEYAIGALAETGETVWNDAEHAAADPAEVERSVANEKVEASRRIQAYRNGRPLPDLTGTTVILIDDGIATGLTIRAAIAAARHQHAAKIILAVPHGAKETIEGLRREVDEVIVLEEPALYASVGQFYQEFPQTSDDEVVALLQTYGQAS